MDTIINSFTVAEQGKKFWTKIKGRYGYQNGDLLLLLPMNCDELNKIAIQYIPFYIKKKHIEHAFILHKKNMKYWEPNMLNTTNIELTENQMEQLIRLYKLIQFEKNIIAIIPEFPVVSVGIFRKKGITAEDYVKNTFFEKVVK